MPNILILSAGTRNKIVQYFKVALQGNGKVVATDMSDLAPAIYEADAYYLVPGIHDSNYINIVLNICKKEKITGVLSLIDPELSILAANESLFEDAGVTIIGAPYVQCERALDKYEMYEWLKEHNYKCAKTYFLFSDFKSDFENGMISFPVFIKPRWGSASIAISKVEDMKTLELMCDNAKDYIIQEFLDGQEIGADVYIDLISHKPVSIFTKKKIKMRAGETDKSVSFKDDRLFSLIEQFAVESGYLGQIDIDIFDIDGSYYISEVNPRFGGGYPHAYECGCDHMKLIANNLSGIENVNLIGSYEENVYMMKYNEIKILKK